MFSGLRFAFVIEPSPSLSHSDMKDSYTPSEIDYRMTAVAPLALMILFEAALKSRMYSGYAPCVAECHVRLRRPDIFEDIVRGRRELLLSIAFGLLLIEHRAFYSSSMSC